MNDRPIPSYRDIRKKATDKVECHLCGVCCELAEGDMECTHGDITRWLREGREDILKYVHYSLDDQGNPARFDREIWLDPKSEEPRPVGRCPFFVCTWENGFRCSIWQTRPFACADFEFAGERCHKARARLLRK